MKFKGCEVWPTQLNLSHNCTVDTGGLCCSHPSCVFDTVILLEWSCFLTLILSHWWYLLWVFISSHLSLYHQTHFSVFTCGCQRNWSTPNKHMLLSPYCSLPLIFPSAFLLKNNDQSSSLTLLPPPQKTQPTAPCSVLPEDSSLWDTPIQIV